MSLVTPFRGGATALAELLGQSIGAGIPSSIERPGYVTCGHWNPEHEGWAIDASFDNDAWKRLSALGIHDIGVCDSIDQFHARHGAALDADDGEWCVVFTHVPKNPENAGQGGGWRWHKWGTYIGEGAPTTEYLDDEPEFNDGVWTYHVYPVLEPA